MTDSGSSVHEDITAEAHRSNEEDHQGSLRGTDTQCEVPQAVAEEQRFRVNEVGTTKYLPLYRAAKNGVWKKIEQGLLEDPTINLGTPITMFSENIIHIIVCRGIGTSFLKKHIDETVDARILSTVDARGNTALSLAAMVGNTKAAKILVGKHEALITRGNSEVNIAGKNGHEVMITVESDGVPTTSLLTMENSDNLCPIYIAATYRHEKITKYLLSMMLRPTQVCIFEGEKGVLLLNLLITAAFYDMARDLLKVYPDLAHGKDISGTSPIQTFANRPLSGKHGDAVVLIKLICSKMHAHHLNTTPKEEENRLSDDFWNPLVTAVRVGIHEIVEEIIEIYPHMIWLKDEHDHTIYHQAVQYRHEKIFNLLLNLGADKYRVVQYVSSIDNSNILHLAASMKLSTTATAYKNRVSGAALQMQRELQWFEEVKKIAPLSFQDQAMDKNDERTTPIMMFIDEHTELAKKGEKWMINAATAYSVVTALVITVLFAAAFQVPGGNNDAGIPIFLHKSSFKIFSTANTIGFLSSSTSLMIFLGILTSRYSGMDFLHSLPRKLIIGLSTLFLSIGCMLVAFGAALYIYAVHMSRHVMIPIIVGTCIPAVLFILLQFPLLWEVIWSTYGRSIFRQTPLTSFRSTLTSVLASLA